MVRGKNGSITPCGGEREETDPPFDLGTTTVARSDMTTMAVPEGGDARKTGMRKRRGKGNIAPSTTSDEEIRDPPFDLGNTTARVRSEMTMRRQEEKVGIGRMRQEEREIERSRLLQ